MCLITDVRFSRKVNDFSYTKRAKVSCIVRAMCYRWKIWQLSVVTPPLACIAFIQRETKISSETNLKLNIEIKREMKR